MNDLREKIKLNLDNPDELEKLNHNNPEEFKKVITELFAVVFFDLAKVKNCEI